jgi:hypothetical protein
MLMIISCLNCQTIVKNNVIIAQIQLPNYFATQHTLIATFTQF